jgi:hypothetical protein
MVDYLKAVERPFIDLRKLCIGILVYVIPTVLSILGPLFASATNIEQSTVLAWIFYIILYAVLLLFYAFGVGYLLRCARSAAVKDFALPSWHGWKEMLIQGITAMIISLIYMLPALFFGFLVGIAGLVAVSEKGIPVMNIYSIIFFILLIITAYILPMVGVNYAVKREAAAGFELKVILSKVFTLKYLQVFLLTLVYSVILGLLASLVGTVSSVTIVGPFIVTALVSFISGVTVLTLTGEVYGEIDQEV